MTDWAVATSASGDGVNVTTWQNFGHRAGADLVLKTLVAGGYAEHYCRIVKFPAGCVKEAFETGDGSRLESLDMRIWHVDGRLFGPIDQWNGGSYRSIDEAGGSGNHNDNDESIVTKIMNQVYHVY